MRKLIPILIVLLVGGSAVAGCPDTDGVFTYADGSLLPGRTSEGWCAGNPGQPGNTENAMSWDGATLGTEWHIWGMQIIDMGAGNNPQLQYSTVDGNGNGIAAYHTEYEGGQIWLSKDGGWGDGVNDVAGTIMTCIVDIQITYAGGVPVQANSNIFINGAVDDCPNNCVIEYIVTNAAMAWHPAWGTPMPGDYPGFLCSASLGELFDICCPRMSLDCAVPDELFNWGDLKSVYR